MQILNQRSADGTVVQHNQIHVPNVVTCYVLRVTFQMPLRVTIFMRVQRCFVFSQLLQVYMKLRNPIFIFIYIFARWQY